MDHKRAARSLRAMLLTASVLTAAPVLAQEQSTEARLDRLERLVEGLIARLDAEATTDQVEEAEIREQSAALLAATRDLKDRQTELAQQIAVPKGQEDKGFRVGKTTVAYAGYVKLDTLVQRTSGGQMPDNSIGRDFLIPALIPVGGTASGYDTDYSARQTRFILKTATDVGAAHTLNSHIELDFNVTDGGDERTTNSYTPRLRQAFITYDSWLFGQAWSTFQNIAALPDSLDFIGVTPGTVFDRQPQIRWSKNGWQIALEQPETTVTTRTGARIMAGDDTIPDVVARYNLTRPWGSLTAAGIVRTLRISDDDFGTGTDSAMAYGLSVSGKIKVGAKDDIRFMATAGDGLGRYIGLNIVNDAALDAAGNLDLIFTWSGFAAYQHHWGGRLRSSIAGAYFKADNPVVLTTRQVTDESWNGFANLIWNPVDPLDIGIELLYATRTLEDGRTGDLRRLMISTRYNF
ncbi:DcaP family trimeric outer membrane transporter [uncultured Erythrobacter sp.]|uniref:DcaP family trimeric outer membrane transporter n=1 Tax=uncultured Erythrobacter sp. TaxID=263913 RepID=UPI00265983AE|nr:DcaP family trimeric outer membrane transporter [uncultured Erythrobacter sp.]